MRPLSLNVELFLFGILALLKLLYGHPNIKGNVNKEKVISPCGFNHKASKISGIILSPEFPSKYPNNRECHWYLSSNQNITLEIIQLDIEEQLDCGYDYLDIYAGSVHNETLLYRLCGGIQNRIIITNSSDLHLFFNSDLTYDGKGFELSYYSGESLKPSGVNICPSMSTAEGVGFVFSKGYPRQNYENNAHCVYPIQVEKEEKIYLNFLDLRLEKDRSCNYDYISVYDGSTNKSSPIGKFCFGIPPPIISTGSQLLIEFKSDNEYNGVGFMVAFSSKGFVDSSGNIGGGKVADLYLTEFHEECANDNTYCLWKRRENGGSIKSPNFPQNYHQSSFCKIKINAPNAHIIQFVFDFMKIELSANCSNDFILIEENISKDCLWKRRENGGSIKSPNFPQNYHQSSFCKIKINAPNAHIIQFVFDFMKIELSANCSNDFILIEENISKEKTEMNKVALLCGSKKATKIVTTTNNVDFTFKSDTTYQMQGFDLSYSFSIINTDLGFGSKTVIGSAKKTFLYVSKDAEVPEGQKYAISCIPTKHTSIVHWFKSDIELKNERLPSGILIKGSTLVIRRMSSEVAGNFTCKIPLSGSEISNATIFITQSPVTQICNFKLKETPRDIIVNEKTEHRVLGCKAFDSKVTITWEKDGIPITDSLKFRVLPNGYLVLGELDATDEGLFTCIGRKSGSECQVKASAVVIIKRKEKTEDVCGVVKIRNLKENEDHNHSSAIKGKIIGGTYAKKGFHPWQVLFWDSQTRIAFCGGTLVNDRWVISAAHCFIEYKSFNMLKRNVLVKLGKTFGNITEDEEFQSKIEEIVNHPSYDVKTYDNDLVLLKLKNQVHFTPYIIPICLRDTVYLDNVLKMHNKFGVITGWGKTLHGSASNILKRVNLPIVDFNTCKASTKQVVTKNMFCAGYAKATVGDSCQGDSGGPLAIEHDGRSYLAGIVSWGIGCASENHFGFYTKVSLFYNWINNIINS